MHFDLTVAIVLRSETTQCTPVARENLIQDTCTLVARGRHLYTSVLPIVYYVIMYIPPNKERLRIKDTFYVHKSVPYREVHCIQCAAPVRTCRANLSLSLSLSIFAASLPPSLQICGSTSRHSCQIPRSGRCIQLPEQERKYKAHCEVTSIICTWYDGITHSVSLFRAVCIVIRTNSPCVVLCVSGVWVLRL